MRLRTLLSDATFPKASRLLPMLRHWLSPLSELMESCPSSCFFAALSLASDIGVSIIPRSILSIALRHLSRFCLSQPRLIAIMPVSEYWVYDDSTP